MQPPPASRRARCDRAPPCRDAPGSLRRAPVHGARARTTTTRSSLSLAFTGIQKAGDRRRHLVPAAALTGELLFAGRRQPVILGALVVLRKGDRKSTRLNSSH